MHFFQITHTLDPLIMEPKPRITVAFVSSRRLDLDEMEEDEDEEDDDDDDFDFSTAGIKSKLPGKRIVEMKVIRKGAGNFFIEILEITFVKVLEENRTFLVKCRLPWTWQWMRVRNDTLNERLIEVPILTFIGYNRIEVSFEFWS